MSEVAIVDAIDGAEFVKARSIGGLQYVQAWHGGTTVNVYVVKTQFTDTWDEVTCWTISDEEGRPVDQETVEKHMEMHFANLMDEAAGVGGRDE